MDESAVLIVTADLQSDKSHWSLLEPAPEDFEPGCSCACKCETKEDICGGIDALYVEDCTKDPNLCHCWHDGCDCVEEILTEVEDEV